MPPFSQAQRDILSLFEEPHVVFLFSTTNNSPTLWAYAYEPELGKLRYRTKSPGRTATLEVLTRQGILAIVPADVVARLDVSRNDPYIGNVVYVLTPEAATILSRPKGPRNIAVHHPAQRNAIDTAATRLDAATAALKSAVDGYSTAGRAVETFIRRADTPDWVAEFDGQILRHPAGTETSDMLEIVASEARESINHWISARAAYYQAIIEKDHARHAYLDLAPWLLSTT